jgi:uroporphyrinogen-III synthase
MNNFLFGRTLVVTRATEQARALSEYLVREGATVIELPMVEIQDPEDGGAALEKAAHDLKNYDWVVVTSPNAASRLVEVLDEVVPSVPFAVIGNQTAEVLVKAGYHVKLIPKKAVGESLLSEFTSPNNDEEKILFIRAEKVRPLLANGLRNLGWRVEEVIAYRNVQPQVDEEKLNQAQHADAVIFASTSAVERYTALNKESTSKTALCIGPITAKAASENGYKDIYQADPYSIEGLISAAREWAAN